MYETLHLQTFAVRPFAENLQPSLSSDQFLRNPRILQIGRPAKGQLTQRFRHWIRIRAARSALKYLRHSLRVFRTMFRQHAAAARTGDPAFLADSVAKLVDCYGGGIVGYLMTSVPYVAFSKTPDYLARLLVDAHGQIAVSQNQPVF